MEKEIKFRRTFMPHREMIGQAIELWVTSGKTAKEVAAIVGCHEVSVNTWITKHFIYKPERNNIVICIFSRV